MKTYMDKYSRLMKISKKKKNLIFALLNFKSNNESLNILEIYIIKNVFTFLFVKLLLYYYYY